MINMNFLDGASGLTLLSIVLLIIWSLFWKGLALWHAVKRDEKKWFAFILVLNTVGILEIIYLFHVVKINLRDLRQ
jgi:uncharacterized membrane protein